MPFAPVGAATSIGFMFGIWIVIIFGIIPAAAGVALTYALSKEEEPNRKRMAIGGAVGAVIGLALGIALVLMSNLVVLPALAELGARARRLRSQA